MAYCIGLPRPKSEGAAALVLHLPRWTEVCDGMHDDRFSVPGNPHRSCYPTDAGMSEHEVRVLVLLSRLPVFAGRRDADNASAARAIASCIASIGSSATSPVGERHYRRRLRACLRPYGADFVEGAAAAEIGAKLAVRLPCMAPSKGSYFAAV